MIRLLINTAKQYQNWYRPSERDENKSLFIYRHNFHSSDTHHCHVPQNQRLRPKVYYDNFQNPSTHKIFIKLLVKHASGQWWTASSHLSSSLFSSASTCSGTWPQSGRHSGSRNLGGRCRENRPVCRRAAGNESDLLALRACRSHGTPYTPPGEVCGG